MSKQGKFLFLGSGGSMGIPIIGCECPICTSDSSFNKRLRPSALITLGEKTVLVDCGPDFRLQALGYGIKTLDGVIITHAHQDHTGGIDDLRIYTFRRGGTPLPCLLSKSTLDDLKYRFYYIYKDAGDYQKLTTAFENIVLDGTEGNLNFLGMDIQYVTYEQGGMPVNGFRFGDLAYLTDIKNFDESIFKSLKNLKTLIISALRFIPSHLHLSVDEAVDFAHRVGAEQTYFTHIGHELEYEKTNAVLPANIQLAYDGLELTFEI